MINGSGPRVAALRGPGASDENGSTRHGTPCDGTVAAKAGRRLNAHASGHRSGNQCCVYIGNRFVVPELTASQQQQLAAGSLSLDLLTS